MGDERKMGKRFDLGAMIETVSGLQEEAAPQVRDIEVITEEILSLKQTAGSAILSIGDRLIEAKGMLTHGEWLSWLEDRVEFTERTAQRFMRLAREWRNPTALSDLGATKALTLLALPLEEREKFIKEVHVVNGEEKSVSDMTSRELEQAVKDAEQARADARTAEEARTKMEADMLAVKATLEARQAEAEKYRAETDALRAELEELKSRPVDVAVMSVDQEKLDKARADAISEMQSKVDRAEAAKDKAEEARRAAEAALKETREKLESSVRADRKAAIAADAELATFELLFSQVMGITNKLHGILLKAHRREDSGKAAGMKNALAALAESIRKAAEV